MGYREDLISFYGRQYANDNCPHYQECSSDMPTCGHRFSVARIGKDYGKTGKPRILFVGKEGTDKPGVVCRTELNEPISLRDPCFRKDNWHFIGTIYTAAMILFEKPCVDLNNIEALYPFDELRHDFCLTNYFKCTFIKPENVGRYHDIQTNSAMKRNCANILIEEIKVLKPDIIIVQGKHCHSSFWGKKGLCSFSDYIPQEYKPDNNINISVTKYKRHDDGSVFYVLWGFHPCAHGRKWFNTLPVFNQAITYIKSDWQKENK